MTPFLKHFSLREFFCNCSTVEILGTLDSPCVIPNLMRLSFILGVIRRRIGVPMIINSGYRNDEHNSRVGGVPTSQHLLGSAADVRKSSKLCSYFNFHRDELHDLLEFLHSLDIYQLIEYDTFYHIGIYDDKHDSEHYPSVYIDNTTKIPLPEE